MKNNIIKHVQNLSLLLIGFFISVTAMAQDGGLDIDVNVGKKEWYQQPWAWVVGGALFILILVALLRKRK